MIFVLSELLNPKKYTVITVINIEMLINMAALLQICKYNKYSMVNRNTEIKIAGHINPHM